MNRFLVLVWTCIFNMLKRFWLFFAGLPSSQSAQKNNINKNTNIGSTVNTGSFSGNTVGGDQIITLNLNQENKQQEKEQQEKNEAISIFNAAYQDLEYNGPYIGDPKVPFATNGIRKLLEYSGPYVLDQKDTELFQGYCKNAGICNGRDGGIKKARPTHVQAQSKQLKALLERHRREKNIF